MLTIWQSAGLCMSPSVSSSSMSQAEPLFRMPFYSEQNIVVLYFFFSKKLWLKEIQQLRTHDIERFK